MFICLKGNCSAISFQQPLLLVRWVNAAIFVFINTNFDKLHFKIFVEIENYFQHFSAKEAVILRRGT